MSGMKAGLKSNSKGKLAGAVANYQKALRHYANESNWAVRSETVDGEEQEWIVWLGDDDPTYAAQVVLGQRRPSPYYRMSDSARERMKEVDSEQRGPTKDTSKGG